MADGGSERGSSRMDQCISDPALSWLTLSPLRDEISDGFAFWSSILESPNFPSSALHSVELVPFGPLRATDDASSGSSNSLLVQESRELDVLYAPERNAHVVFDSMTPLDVLDRPLLRSSNYPLGCPVRTANARNETVVLGSYSVVNVNDLMIQGNRSSARQEARDFPEFQFQRLMELQGARHGPNSRSSHSSEAQGHDSDAGPLTCPERLMHNILRLRRSLDAANKNRVEKEEVNECAAANFECNICYDLAKDPVVTPCGHLFCWSCIYQWLYVYSVESECPVCKGEVLEVNVTPIYGHGVTEAMEEKKSKREVVSCMEVPPRPRAHRIEIPWQRHRGILFEPVELIRDSSRLIRGGDMQVSARTGADRNSDTQRSVVTRLRAQAVSRDEVSESDLADVDLPTGATLNPQHHNTLGSQDRSRPRTRSTTLAERNSYNQVQRANRRVRRSRWAAD